jgi:hypothetical protein
VSGGSSLSSLDESLTSGRRGARPMSAASPSPTTPVTQSAT